MSTTASGLIQGDGTTVLDLHYSILGYWWTLVPWTGGRWNMVTSKRLATLRRKVQTQGYLLPERNCNG